MGDMAAVGFRQWARTLSKGRLSGVSALLTPHRAASGPSKDMLPAGYPETPEQLAAAARKYNMTLEDYKPYADNGEGFGDYPQLPNRSQHERDPWYEWDDPELRRNWNEPMHWNFDMYTRNRVDTSPTPRDWADMSKQFPTYQPVAPKQYPYNNLYLERGGDPNVG